MSLFAMFWTGFLTLIWTSWTLAGMSSAVAVRTKGSAPAFPCCTSVRMRWIGRLTETGGLRMNVELLSQPPDHRLGSDSRYKAHRPFTQLVQVLLGATTMTSFPGSQDQTLFGSLRAAGGTSPTCDRSRPPDPGSPLCQGIP